MTGYKSTVREWSTDMPINETKVYGNWDDYDAGNYRTEVKPTSSAKAFLGGFASRFKDNMADYFGKNPDAFDFTNKGGKSTSDKVAAFTEQFKSGFSPVAEGFGIYQPPTNPMSVIPGQQGSPGLLSQIAGPVAGAAASALFACDMRLKHDVNCLTVMNLVKDDLADVAYFVKELQDS